MKTMTIGSTVTIDRLPTADKTATVVKINRVNVKVRGNNGIIYNVNKKLIKFNNEPIVKQSSVLNETTPPTTSEVLAVNMEVTFDGMTGVITGVNPKTVSVVLHTGGSYKVPKHMAVPTGKTMVVEIKKPKLDEVVKIDGIVGLVSKLNKRNFKMITAEGILYNVPYALYNKNKK